MADDKLIPLSVAQTVPRYNPIGSLLEGLASGLSAYLATRYKLEQDAAEQARQQKQLNLQERQVTEQERAGRFERGRAADLDTLKARIEQMGIDAATRDLEHQRQLLALQGQLERARLEGKAGTKTLAAGIAKQALELETLGAEQEVQGNPAGASILRAKATDFWNMARISDSELVVPTTRERRAEGFRNAGLSEEEIQTMFFVDDNFDSLSLQDRSEIARQYPRISQLVVPEQAQGYLLNPADIEAAARAQVKTTERPVTTAGKAIGSAFRKEVPVLGIPATIFHGASLLFKERPKSESTIESEAAKAREEILKRQAEYGQRK